jgi:hypothetical protein
LLFERNLSSALLEIFVPSACLLGVSFCAQWLRAWLRVAWSGAVLAAYVSWAGAWARAIRVTAEADAITVWNAINEVSSNVISEIYADALHAICDNQ